MNEMKQDIYLFTSGTLKRKDNTLFYQTKEKELYFPIMQIRCIHVFGEVQFNKKLLALLTKNSIAMSFYDYQGRYMGQYVPAGCKTGKMIVEQVNAWQTASIRNGIASAIVQAEMDNCLETIRYYAFQEHINGCQELFFRLLGYVDEIQRLDQNDEQYITKLMLQEARAKTVYYRLFDLVIDDPYFHFGKRSTYPPGNAFNCLLSFGYAILYSNTACEIDKSNLLRDLGFIHGLTHHTEGALQYDLADISKSYMIDRKMIEMVRSNTVQKEDFYQRNDGGIFLSKEGRKKVVQYLDQEFQKTVFKGERKVSYRGLLQRDVYALEKTIRNHTDFQPFVLKAGESV